VHGEIAHALDVGCGVQCGHDDAQVGGDGWLEREEGERVVLGSGAEVVDAGVGGDDPLRQRQVGAQHGAGGVVEGVDYQIAHVGQTPPEVVELVLVDLAHEARVAPFGCR